MSEKIGVWQALKAAFGFWPRGVARTSGVLVLAGISTAWSLYVAGQKGTGFIWISASLISSLMQLMAYGALYRTAYGAKKPNEPDFALGPLGFQSGRVETSVVLAGLLTNLLLGFVMLLLLMGLVALTAGLSVALGTEGQSFEAFVSHLDPSKPIVLAAMVAASVLFIWLSARLSLAMAASAAERRVRALSSWPLTKGRALLLTICFLVIILPVLVVGETVPYAIEALGRLAPALRPDIEAGALIAGAIASVVYIFPLLAGLTAYVYERVGPTPSPEAKAP